MSRKRLRHLLPACDGVVTPQHVRRVPAGPRRSRKRLITIRRRIAARAASAVGAGKLQHVLAVAAVVADAADVDGDHRQTREHRLGHDDAEALRLREVEEDVRFDRLRDPVGPVAVQESRDPEGRGQRAASRSPALSGPSP